MTNTRPPQVCPLCRGAEATVSRLPKVHYVGKEFRYLRCRACGSLYCDPMPDDELLARMYGPEYAHAFGENEGDSDPKQPERVMQRLAGMAPGTFVDYGCGSGSLLREARKMGWVAIGVEFDPRVARETELATGCPVVAMSQLADSPLQADVLHLGDVIEHLTRMDAHMEAILQQVKPGGLLLTQGPLEANLTLFTVALQAGQAVRRKQAVAMAPYHVLQATSRGQRMLFSRLGLHEVEYQIHEVAWPAPARLTLSVARRPRSLSLFVLRRASMMLSALRPGKWGNRYFYVGRKVEHDAVGRHEELSPAVVRVMEKHMLTVANRRGVGPCSGS